MKQQIKTTFNGSELESFSWYKKALESGDKDVLFDIAKVYEQIDIQNAAKNMPEGDELIEYELSDITLEWYKKELSNYENNYNEKYEKEIDEIMKPLIENGTGYDYQFLFDQLNERYEQTNYPGFIYTIGFLYQRKILKSDNSKEHIIYYQRAAEQNYLYALLRLNETFLNDIDFELSEKNCKDMYAAIAGCLLNKYLGPYLDEFKEKALNAINKAGNAFNDMLYEELSDARTFAAYAEQEAFLLEKAKIQIKGLTKDNLTAK